MGAKVNSCGMNCKKHMSTSIVPILLYPVYRGNIVKYIVGICSNISGNIFLSITGKLSRVSGEYFQSMGEIAVCKYQGNETRLPILEYFPVYWGNIFQCIRRNIFHCIVGIFSCLSGNIFKGIRGIFSVYMK